MYMYVLLCVHICVLLWMNILFVRAYFTSDLCHDF